MSNEQFIQVLLDLLKKYPRCAGKIIEIGRGLSSELDLYTDFKLYMDTYAESALRYYEYQYIPQRSDANHISVLDLTHGYREYSNCIDEIEYSYDAERDELIETVVASGSKEEE